MAARLLNKVTKESVPPLVPYMGIVIQSIITLQEFPDRIAGDRINFKKVRRSLARSLALVPDARACTSRSERSAT